MPKEKDWIVAYDSTMGELAYALECRRCGTLQRVATPIDVTLYCAMVEAFGKIHGRCRPRSRNKRPNPNP